MQWANNFPIDELGSTISLKKIEILTPNSQIGILLSSRIIAAGDFESKRLPNLGRLAILLVKMPRISVWNFYVASQVYRLIWRTNHR
ncbi:hypothetical protein [Richelia intracellularis]|uniref:hypothetical protein n=1 Tax=Richelia intracellularis TaxID=1164990 RepID=UPI0005C7CCC5|nr:hypothetical protein [Richelia intracellularis]HAE06420.1 hypothetical protein [Richelia sp.]